MEGTKLIRCNCEHADQDKMYGKGMRLHNRVDVKGKTIGYACTVCTPRRLPCDRHAQIDPNPMLGIRFTVMAPKNRMLKPV